MSKQSPKSMKDFDYFEDGAKPAAPEDYPEDVPTGVEAQLAALRTRAKRYRRTTILGIAFFGVATWFVYDYRFEMQYAFAAPRPAKDMGSVTRLQPGALVHNDFVKVNGITEHRGMRTELTRGLTLNRSEYWYMRLMGSRGVFVELPPDPEKYGFATEVTVEGRVVDPSHSGLYRRLLEDYAGRFFPRESPTVRFVQVGVTPGSNKGPYILMLVVLGLIGLFNAWTLWRWSRVMKERPLIRA